MEKFFYYNTKNGKILPVVKNGNGDYTIFNQRSRKPLQSFTDKLIHSFGKNGRQIFENHCTVARVKSLDDLFDRMDKADKLLEIVIHAENELREAKEKIRSLLYPVLSYTETKAMGCTDIVYWDGEPQTNPKTGNEFFAPEDAKILFASLKAEKAKEIAEKLREIVLEHNISEDEDEFDAEYYWNLDNYIWEEAANLDDLIDEEKKN